MNPNIQNRIIDRAIDFIYKNAYPNNKRLSIAIVTELKLLKKKPLPMTTLEKLEKKATSSFRDKIRMPSITAIAKLLTELNIDFELSDSTNIVEHKTKGRTYVNSLHRGKEGKMLVIKIYDDRAEKLGWRYLCLDSSDSYYSYNTSGYASDLIALIKLKTKKL